MLNAYTGILRDASPVLRRVHDPDLAIWTGTLPPWGPRTEPLAVGGAGWDDDEAHDACIGEAIERMQSYPFPDDRTVEAGFADWPLDEPAVDPERWVLFHRDQYALSGFPFRPFTRDVRCRWVCFRDIASGAPRWLPEEFAYLSLRPGEKHVLCPGISTGLACGRVGQPVVLRALQEVIERDAVVGAWWGRYAIEEHAIDVPDRVRRPNLRYRFYRVDSPFNAHVTLITVEGEDTNGFCFGVGSACRETRDASWRKSLAEAIHGFRYAGFLRTLHKDLSWVDTLSDFPHHAAYYSAHPERLDATVLRHARSPADARSPAHVDALFRIMTPPGIAREHRDWIVVRVLVPGLQPLHGNDAFAHLGGPLWAPLSLADFRSVPPHPFA